MFTQRLCSPLIAMTFAAVTTIPTLTMKRRIMFTQRLCSPLIAMTFAAVTMTFAAVTSLMLPPSIFAAEVSDENLLAGAAARIEKHRQADVVVTVVDAAGKPVPGAKVTVEQTRHAFLFGCNLYRWGKLPDEKLEAAYRRQFAELLNYATLGFYWASYERNQGEPNHEYTRPGRPMVPGTRHHDQGPSAGLELRRSGVAARRSPTNTPVADGPDRGLRVAFRRADRPLGRG